MLKLSVQAHRRGRSWRPCPASRQSSPCAVPTTDETRPSKGARRLSGGRQGILQDTIARISPPAARQNEEKHPVLLRRTTPFPAPRNAAAEKLRAKAPKFDARRTPTMRDDRARRRSASYENRVNRSKPHHDERERNHDRRHRRDPLAPAQPFD